VIWLVAIVFNLPLLLTIYYNKQSDFCMQYWPQQWMVKVNTIVWFLVTGVIPIVLMTVLYLRVVNALWFQNEDRSDNVRQVSIASTERFLSFDSYDTKRFLRENIRVSMDFKLSLDFLTILELPAAKKLYRHQILPPH